MGLKIDPAFLGVLIDPEPKNFRHRFTPSQDIMISKKRTLSNFFILQPKSPLNSKGCESAYSPGNIFNFLT